MMHFRSFLKARKVLIINYTFKCSILSFELQNAFYSNIVINYHNSLISISMLIVQYRSSGYLKIQDYQPNKRELLFYVFEKKSLLCTSVFGYLVEDFSKSHHLSQYSPKYKESCQQRDFVLFCFCSFRYSGEKKKRVGCYWVQRCTIEQFSILCFSDLLLQIILTKDKYNFIILFLMNTEYKHRK